MTIPAPKFSTIAFYGALAVAGYSGTAFAVPMVPDDCPGQSGFQTSQVLDAVDPLGNDRFDYGFRVCNTSLEGEFGGPLLRDWELPWFGSGSGKDITQNDSDIQNIATPEDWDWSIEQIGSENVATGYDGSANWQVPGDPMKIIFDNFFGGAANNPYNDVTHVLHFWTECFEGGGCIDPDDFGFEAGFDSTNAPYQASWEDLPPQTGDPAFPLGVQPTNPAIQQALNNIPEPGTLAMLAAGLGAMGLARRRRKVET